MCFRNSVYPDECVLLSRIPLRPLNCVLPASEFEAGSQPINLPQRRESCYNLDPGEGAHPSAHRVWGHPISSPQASPPINPYSGAFSRPRTLESQGYLVVVFPGIIHVRDRCHQPLEELYLTPTNWTARTRAKEATRILYHAKSYHRNIGLFLTSVGSLYL